MQQPTSIRRRPGRRLKTQDDAVAQELYLSYLPKQFTVTAALSKANVPASALQRWREDDPHFVAREKLARDALADALEAEAIRRAFKGVRTPVYQGGLLAGYITQYSDMLLSLMLKALRPERYREKAEINVSPIIKVVAGFEPSDVL